MNSLGAFVRFFCASRKILTAKETESIRTIVRYAET